ncbi:MAG: S1 RNA-binding domain-containing protein, partial [Desulfobacterales bacterium]
MNDNFEEMTDNGEEENFAELLESYNNNMNEEIRVGDKIRGEIIEIGMDSVFINTGTKIDGVVEKNELVDENGEFTYTKGDILDLYVVSSNESEIQLSKALSSTSGHHMLYDAFENKIPVEGKVSSTCKGGVSVEVMKKQAFCPLSQMDLKYVKDPEEYVGRTFQFLIKRIEEKGKNIIVSRRDFLELDQKEAREQFLKDLAVGKLYNGCVTKLMDFGAFIELFPGIEGMAHISELSWSRTNKPDEVLKENENVQVKVIGVEYPDSSKTPKIALSIKQAGEDPWESVPEKFKKGDIIKGTVTRCMDFGAFVEIAPGTEGLVHISEMSYTKRVLKSESVVKPGESVLVMIKEIDPQKKRISSDGRSDDDSEPATQQRRGEGKGTRADRRRRRRRRYCGGGDAVGRPSRGLPGRRWTVHQNLGTLPCRRGRPSRSFRRGRGGQWTH